MAQQGCHTREMVRALTLDATTDRPLFLGEEAAHRSCSSWYRLAQDPVVGRTGLNATEGLRCARSMLSRKCNCWQPPMGMQLGRETPVRGGQIADRGAPTWQGFAMGPKCDRLVSNPTFLSAPRSPSHPVFCPWGIRSCCPGRSAPYAALPVQTAVPSLNLCSKGAGCVLW
jgi:hypothetical protein